MARVTLEHATKIFPGGTQALADCSLDVADAELVVLVGPSGCGKSTLLRLVAGLETLTSGTIRIGDRVVNDLRPQERNVAMVFQDYALYPHLTARGNLEFPLTMRGLDRAARRAQVERVAALLDIGALLDRLPKALSGGQRQRVAMGRALVREPAAFLMDEPLSNLDPALRISVRAEIKELQRRTRTTTLYVTHDQVEAMTLGDRVAVLERGVLQQVDTPERLYAAPANVFVAGFIGNPPMNLLPVARLPASIRATMPAGAATAGVRPEALAVADPSDDVLRATVAHVEFLGHESLVHAAVDDLRLVARVPGATTVAPGSTIGLRPDVAAVHCFDPRGRALGR